MKTEHILVIRFSAMGDVAMTVPVVYSLAKQYPHVRITVLSRPFARPFFTDLAPNIGFMEADIKGEYKGIKGLNALYRRLVAKQFTAIADLHSVLRSDYLRMRFNLDNFKVAHIDKHRKGKRKLIAANNKQFVQQPTSFQNYADVFARLGYPVDLDFTSIYGEGKGDLTSLPKQIFTDQEGIIHKPGENAAPWIGIAPFAAHKGKIYPTEKMETVIQQLIHSYPQARLYLFGGGKDETPIMNEWAGKYPQVINASAQLSGLSQELNLMSHLDVMLSMDSGNMHLASLVHTPVVSVWGATHPYAGFMGWNQNILHTVQIDLPCRPCSIYGNKPCMRGDYACLNNIEPEMIVERIKKLLK
ncbi:glycosyltransferase family 9 protein [Segatella hominis]|uniref:glycosyltransferase family 9 protein n=1 Tax=Segatella hominis TaxID=2518605 RepID=UPI000336D599|nr:glycosyltransferase family 9 protein [Segatella hominis]WOZ80741.1 glycosyltransferase family 9 protein [Segatella hominis]CDA58162.1 putative ADP-heptose--LPS heptosyltransferase [Prevotella sp. CAG:604]